MCQWYSHFIYVFIQDKAEDLQAIDSCEYIWEAGVGFAHSPPRYPAHDSNRTELLKLLLTCFSETMYQPPVGKWHTLAVFSHTGITCNIVHYSQRAETALSFRCLSSMNSVSIIWQGCTSPRWPNFVQWCLVLICGSSVWNLLYVAQLVSKILRCLLDFWKICAPLSCDIWGFHCGEYWYDMIWYDIMLHSGRFVLMFWRTLVLIFWNFFFPEDGGSILFWILAPIEQAA